MARSWRSFLMIPALIAVCSILGGVYGPGLPGVSAASGEDDIKDSLKSFSEFYDVIERHYADKIDPDKAIYKGAIPGMLRTLDPHSSFFDPRDFQLLREDQKGHYYGVGMWVAGRGGRTIVITPFAGSPAYRAGIRPGDVIVEVDDKSTEGLNTTEVADLLKGPKGTPVQVKIARSGNPDPLVFNIVRDEIPRLSVNDAFFLRPGIAYIDIEQFNENTSAEVDKAIRKLGEENIDGLVLDLRGNPGGLLNEGVAVADRFLRKGQTVVKHRGRASREKPYLASRGNRGKEYPIVVMVDRYSASAAEIVAGALQDHDRAWIVGDNTFGKGLVQTVYPLTENTGLALTTARYYTPSGRLIQRDYANKSFFDYYYRKDRNDRDLRDVKMTDAGRTVYGGNGITPDEKYEPPKITKFQREVLRKYALFNCTAKYFGNHSTDLPKDWEPDEVVIEEFHKFLLDEGVSFTEAEFTGDHEWVRRQLRREMYITAFSIDESRRLQIKTDPAVMKAIESMDKARQLLEDAKKMIARRQQEARE
ncbi:MAG: S41 family peptidase [bacterium]|nr:S41 family peptidase [bacterium]